METKDILKKLREEKGLTIKEVATGTGMQYTMCREYESGDRKLGMSAAIKYADFFGCSVDYLLGRDSQKSNELTPTQREEIATQKWLSLDKEKRDALLQMMETCIKTFEAAESNHKK